MQFNQVSLKKHPKIILIIIKNTSDHIERLGIKFNRDGIKQFLLSTRFLFQGLDRVQFFSTEWRFNWRYKYFRS